MEKEQQTTIYKYGQKIYSLISLRSGIVTDINHENNTVTIDIGGKYGTETGQNANFTTDEEIVMELLREQIEEYKESFFRVNRTLQQKMNMI